MLADMDTWEEQDNENITLAMKQHTIVVRYWNFNSSPSHFFLSFLSYLAFNFVLLSPQACQGVHVLEARLKKVVKDQGKKIAFRKKLKSELQTRSKEFLRVERA